MCTTLRQQISPQGIFHPFRICGSTFCQGRAHQKKSKLRETRVLRKRRAPHWNHSKNKNLTTLKWLLEKSRLSMSLTEWAKDTVRMWWATRSQERCMRLCFSSRDASPTPSMRSSLCPVCINLPKGSCMEMSLRDAKWQRRMFRPLWLRLAHLDRLRPCITRMCSRLTRVDQLWQMSKLTVGTLMVRSLRYKNPTASRVCMIG